MKKEKIEYVTEYDVLYGNNNYLKNRLGIDTNDKENGYIADLWYDCDHVKTYGENGRGDSPFVTLKTKNKTYIVTPYELDCEAYDLIEWWLNGAENEIEIENNWDDWDKVLEGVAYRGGSGYSYALYAKKLK
jgi:hypothetical protein